MKAALAADKEKLRAEKDAKIQELTAHMQSTKAEDDEQIMNLKNIIDKDEKSILGLKS